MHRVTICENITVTIRVAQIILRIEERLARKLTAAGPFVLVLGGHGMQKVCCGSD